MLTYKEIKIRELLNNNPTIIEELSEKEQKAIKERLLLKEKSYKLIAKEYGISVERVRQIVNSIYNRIEKINKLCNMEYIDNNLEIENLLLTKKTYNALKRAGYNTIGDLEKLTKEETDSIYYLGKYGYTEIKNELERLKRLTENKNRDTKKVVSIENKENEINKNPKKTK